MAKQLISESKLATIIEESIKRHLNDAFKKTDDLAAGKFKEKNDNKNIINKTRLNSKRNGKKSNKD